MKKIFRTVAALAVVMFAGCTTDMTNEVVAPVGGKTTVTVGIADTKTYLGDLVDGARKVYWHNGDQIAINGNASTGITLNEEKTTAVFEFDAVTLEHPYSVLYPASMYKDPQTITLPAVQAGATNNFAKDTAPMAAYQEAEGTVQLRHLAGVVRLQVKLPAESTHGYHTLNKVEISGNADEQMSGDFAIDYQTLTLTALSTAEADQIVTTKANKTLSAEETKDVFVVVPAREYAEGFTVRLIDDAGHYMDIVSKAITVEVGEIKAMPVVEFVPTGTLVGVEISSAEELIAFANAYNANEYADVDPLVVTLTQDIIFDEATNAAWTPIGGKFDYGDHYFNGYFDGAGFSIKSWNSTRPLFAYTNSDGVIENLTIDASCTLTANFADEEQYYGAFVGYHRGILVNCHINTSLTATSNWSKEPHIGALVGRVVVGTVENCTVNGDVTFSTTLITSQQNSYYGGAVGRVSNEAGVLKGIKVTGNVSHRAGSTYIGEGSSNASDANVYYGGIVGSLTGTCTNCHLTDADKKFFYGNYVYDEGPTDKTNNHYRTQNVGGIAGSVGENAILSGCNNYAAVTLNQYNGDISGTNKDISRYLYAGGIAGLAYGQVLHCTVYGSIINRSSCLQQYIGGVVGNVQASATISNCANEGSAYQAGTTSLGYYQARNGNFGGVIGSTLSTNLSNLSNKAVMTCSRMNANTGATLTMGGIIGKVEATGEIDGQNTIVNYGTIQSNHTSNDNKYTAIGGVVGESKGSIKGVVNEGVAYYTIDADDKIFKHIYVGGVVGHANNNITLTSVENKGAAYINISKSVGMLHFDLCVGGVLGTNADAKAVTLVGCENSGSAAIKGGGTKTNGRSVAVGGVVGALTNGASSINNCENTGCLSNSSSNNNNEAWKIRTSGGSNYIGGIAGYVEGADGDLLEVSGCTSNKVGGTNDGIGNSDWGIYTLRGASGGLIGGAKYADIKNCNCATKMYNTNSTSSAGLVAAIHSSNLQNCTISDSIVQPNGGGVYGGGFVAVSVASTVTTNTMDNLTISGTGAITTGALVGKSDDASTFTDNAVSGTILGNAITLATTMVGSGNPTVTGTTLYTE